MKILVANVGSTSFKFKLYNMDNESILAQGKIENIGGRSLYSLSSGDVVKKGEAHYENYKDAIKDCIYFLLLPEHNLLQNLHELGAVGFKTVHGKNMKTCRVVDDSVLHAMEEYNFLAPAHNPPYIHAIRIFQDLVPAVPCVALFEPAFHKTIPDYAYTTGLNYEIAEKYGIQKYGFHGASHRYIASRAPVFAGLDPDNCRIISCHLGGSSSICAIKNGQSIDTSMSFSPQSGVLNQNRCGDLDPFIPLFLQKAANLSVDEVARVLDSQSGMAGIAGDHKDVRQIEIDALNGDSRSLLAMRTFCYRVKLYIGSYFAALDGCDLIAFTGGIGEKSALFRKEILSGLDCFGIELDDTKNVQTPDEAIITTEASKVIAAVVPTNEELVVAREVYQILK